MKIKPGFFCWILLLVLAILTACSGKDKPALKVGMNVDFPPFAQIVDGAYVGVDVDLARKIAEKLDLPHEIIQIDFEDLLQSVSSGSVDFAVSGISITEKRSRILEFSQAYYQVDLLAYCREEDSIQINVVGDIGKYRLGVLSGSTSHQWVQSELLLKDLINRDRFHSYVSHQEALQGLLQGKIDLVINDECLVQDFVRQYPVKTVYRIKTGEEYGIAMPKNGKYNKKIKAALEDLIISGELASILQTHGLQP